MIRKFRPAQSLSSEIISRIVGSGFADQPALVKTAFALALMRMHITNCDAPAPGINCLNFSLCQNRKHLCEFIFLDSHFLPCEYLPLILDDSTSDPLYHTVLDHNLDANPSQMHHVSRSSLQTHSSPD